MSRRRLVPGTLLGAIALLLAALPTIVAAEEPAAPAAETKVSYWKDIRPIFQAQCQGCHQPAKKGGGYLMTDHASLLLEGDGGLPGIEPGSPDESYLMAQILPQGDKPAKMPKGTPPLSAVEVELIRKWIAEGAVDDSPPSTAAPIDAAHPPRYELPPVITALEYSPDGALLAVSGYHEVLLHRADGSELVARLVGISERVQSLAFSPDGKWLAVTGGSPGRFGEVQVWNVADRTLAVSRSMTFDTIYGASWSTDSTRVAFGCADNTVRVIEAATGKQVLFQGAHSDWVLDTIFSTDSSHLVSVSRDRSMKLIEVATERFVDNITSITPGALKGGLMTVDRHPQRDELLIGGADGIPKLYKMYREKARVIGDDFNFIRQYEGMPGRVYAAEFNADGSQLVAASSDGAVGEVRVYRTDDAQLVCRCEGQVEPVYSAAFSSDGKTVASGGFDGLVRLNDAQTGKLIREFVPVPVAATVAAAP
ncbi:MAG: hypothetical protein JNG90_02830 [Planctomycetaceae bacterium]|nr:hypothetical protein [Planctomycetaceae bacterium]